jgi:hypothetical protein
VRRGVGGAAPLYTLGERFLNRHTYTNQFAKRKVVQKKPHERVLRHSVSSSGTHGLDFGYSIADSTERINVTKEIRRW